MSLRASFVLVFLIALLDGLHAGHPAAAAPPAGATVELPIDDYLDDDDGAFSWEVAKGDGKAGTTTVIKLTSQSWRAPDEVSRQKWEHWLIIARPETLKTDKCFLLVSGGGNDGANVPNGPSGLVTTIAEVTGSIVVELKQIPNQPIVFHGDGTPRKEDDLIAYCWDRQGCAGEGLGPPGPGPRLRALVLAVQCSIPQKSKHKVVCTRERPPGPAPGMRTSSSAM